MIKKVNRGNLIASCAFFLVAIAQFIAKEVILGSAFTSLGFTFLILGNRKM